MILLNDFKAEPEELIQAEIKATERVIRSGWYILGNEVIAFEKAWSEACKTKYTVAVGNGMDAIEIGLRTLNIGPGDEVITTCMTAFATVLAVLRAGATPVLADIDAGTAQLCMESVQRCLTKKTKAVILVHLYGQANELTKWRSFCDTNKIYFLEDCAQSHLAEWDGKLCGNYGEVSAFSFYPTKNLGALGDGGALMTNREDLASMAQKIRNYGQTERYYHPHIGLNSRLDEMQAAILSVRLGWLKQFTARRQAIAEDYFGKLSNTKIQLLEQAKQKSSHVYHLFVLRVKNREAFMQHMKAKQVASLIHYPVPIHQQEPCRSLSKDPKGLGSAELHAKECVSIPCHPQMTDKDVQTVIDAVNGF